MLLASLAGVALLGLAGWFISAAAFAGVNVVSAAQFNYLLPGAGVRLFAYIRIASRYGERVVNHEAVFRFISKLRVWLFNHLSILSPLQLTFVKNGDLLNRFMNDVGVLDNLVLRILMPILTFFALIVITAAACLFLNIRIGLILLFSNMILMLIVAGIVLTTGRKNGDSYQLALNNFRTFIVNSLQSLREIILFNAMDMQQKLYQQQLNEISTLQAKISKVNGIAQALSVIGIGIMLLLTLLMAIHLTLAKQLNGANIALIVLVVFAIGELLQPVINAFLLIGQIERAALNVNAIMTMTSTFTAPTQNNYSLQIRPQDIVVRQVNFTFIDDEKLILDNMNMAIPAGQHIALVGESGTGKTTFLNLLARFIIPQKGDITVGQYNIFSLTDEQWQALFCIVPQAPYLFDTTIRENLMLANSQATEEMCWQALDICQLKTFIMSLPHGLDTYVGQNGERLSGGQARRLAIARAVLKNAPHTILDEPTEGLDHTTEMAIITALRQYFANKTLIIVSHREAVVDTFPSQYLFSQK